MRNMSTRMFAAVTAGAMLGTLGMTGTSSPLAAGASLAAGESQAAGASAAPGTQLWVSRYNGPGRGEDEATAVATSPDGQTVFVTGSSLGAGASGTSQYATVAYQAGTGAQRWVRRYDNPGGTVDRAVSVAVSPGGGQVFVTGSSSGAGSGGIATVAYSASGAFQWATRFQGSQGEDVSSMAVSPDGKTVFITGNMFGNGSGSESDYLTVAYRAATGAQLWVRRYSGHRGGYDAAASVAISPSGRTVFVTGTSARGTGTSILDFATVAYRAATGARLWVSRYNGPSNGLDDAVSVAAGPGGRTVFVTGDSAHGTGASNPDYATVAYRAATGARLWVRRYNGPANRYDSPAAVVPSTDGRTVFVTGSSTGVHSHQDWATVAYRTATGARLWVKRHDGPVSSEDGAASLAVSPHGNTVFVTGNSWLDNPQNRTAPTEYVTIAYRAATGARLWARHYQNFSADQAGAVSVAVSPAGRVFVTGTSQRNNFDGDGDYATIAYSS